MNKLHDYDQPELEGSPIQEGEFSANEVDLAAIYQMFAANYIKATGKTWTQEKFMSRARAWTFYGDPTKGVLAVRKQRSGLIKLTGSAGSPLAIAKGFKELLSAKAPLWGAVSKDLLRSLQKAGMKSPPAWVVKMFVAKIPAGVFGGYTPTIEKDGGLTFDYPDVGKATKYFIGTPSYYKKMLSILGDQLPKAVQAVFRVFATGKDLTQAVVTKIKSWFMNKGQQAPGQVDEGYRILNNYQTIFDHVRLHEAIQNDITKWIKTTLDYKGKIATTLNDAIELKDLDDWTKVNRFLTIHKSAIIASMFDLVILTTNGSSKGAVMFVKIVAGDGRIGIGNHQTVQPRIPITVDDQRNEYYNNIAQLPSKIKWLR